MNRPTNDPADLPLHRAALAAGWRPWKRSGGYYGDPHEFVWDRLDSRDTATTSELRDQLGFSGPQLPEGDR
jgi:hypothetical protein